MSFRFSSSVSRDCANNLLGQSSKVEQDRRVTPCTVDLYIRPVEGSDIAEHWVLHFRWQHYNESYEANQNEEGALMPRVYEGEPEVVENLRYNRKIRIANDLRVYPDTVRELAKKNELNFKKYNVLTCNCQHWILKLGKQLQLDLPDCQVTEGVDITATAGIASLTVASIAKALNKN